MNAKKFQGEHPLNWKARAEAAETDARLWRKVKGKFNRFWVTRTLDGEVVGESWQWQASFPAAGPDDTLEQAVARLGGE